MNYEGETSILKALSKGDPKSFELLFLQYQPKLVYFLIGFIKDSEIARDIAQDIFLSVWNNREKLSQVNSFKAYLFKMGKNAICNYFDHSLVKEKYKAEQLSHPNDSVNMEESIFVRELEGLIAIAVSQMPVQRKLIYTKSRIEGLSNSEIAIMLNLNKRTVENQLTSALSDIRKKIKFCLILFC